MKIQRVIKRAGASFVAVLSGIPAALAQYDIGTSGGERGIEVVEAYLQDWVNFATGPWGLVIILAGLVLGLTFWVLAPRAGGFGIALRAIAAGIVIINMATFVTGLVAG